MPKALIEGLEQWERAGFKSRATINLKASTYALISGHPGGGEVTPGNPRAFAQRRLQIPPTQKEDFLTKSYKRPSLGGKEVCFAKSNSTFES